AEVGGSGLDLSNAFARDDDFVSDGADSQSDVNALLFRDFENDFRRGVFLETSCRDTKVIGIARKTRDDVSAIGVGKGGTSEATRAIFESDSGASDGRASRVNDGAANVARILRSRERRKTEQNNYCNEERMEQNLGKVRTERRCTGILHDATSKN